MAQNRLTPQSESFSDWYNEIVVRAELVDDPRVTPGKGSMIIKPYGFELWEGIRAALDSRFKATGHVNAYFPLLIPYSLFQKEGEFVQGFSPELAVVTHGGGEELAEPLVVRPTSEMIIGDAMSRWIKSYRDLPLLLNQWANVMRWELRTRPFLRTTEFLWQEGHTAHATHDEAEAEAMQMLGVYADFAINEAAIPVIQGAKSEQEKFPGALRSYTIEAMMRDGRALQSGTSHNLGQNFATKLNIQYLDPNNQMQTCWTTSWGLSTRVIGAIVMTHGDDKGLRLPPRLAPIQVVIVPIFKTDDEKSPVMEKVASIARELKAAGLRIKVDDRDNVSPGYKFNDWEMRGVPLRLEVGPKDVQNNSAALARRDVTGKEGKQFVPANGLAARVQELLTDIQAGLLRQAAEFRDAHIHEVVSDYGRFQEIIRNGEWALTWFSGEREAELKIKEENQAVSRCFPFDQPHPGETGPCIITGQPTNRMALFAKAY